MSSYQETLVRLVSTGRQYLALSVSWAVPRLYDGGGEGPRLSARLQD